MTTLSPPPARENDMQSAAPASRWRRLIPRSHRGKTAVAGGLAVLLVAGLLGATYETSPGGALWGAEKAVFPDHAQDVALAAVVNDLKKAQGHPRRRAAAHTRSADRSPHVTQSGQAGLGLPVTITAADQPAEPLFATDTTTSAVHPRDGPAAACAARTAPAAGHRPGQPAADRRSSVDQRNRALLGIPDHR